MLNLMSLILKAIEVLKLKSGILIYKIKEGPALFIETIDHRFYPTGISYFLLLV